MWQGFYGGMAHFSKFCGGTLDPTASWFCFPHPQKPRGNTLSLESHSQRKYPWAHCLVVLVPEVRIFLLSEHMKETHERNRMHIAKALKGTLCSCILHG